MSTDAPSFSLRCAATSVGRSAFDEATGGVRARYFAPGLCIEEDEATGSAAVLLGWLVERDVTISQGEGSVLYVRAPDQGRVAVGGRVRLDRP